jgi:acyl-CoA thioesterase-2
MSEHPAPAAEDFELATRVEGKGGLYTAVVSPGWEIWGPNGGYMATLALRAAAAEAQIKNPASLYCQFLRPARFDRIEARVTVAHSGRRAEAIRVSLLQDDKPVLEGLLRTALPGEGLEHARFRAPEVAPPEGLPTLDELLPEGKSFPFWKNIEARVLLTQRFEPKRGAMPPHWLEWYRFRPTPTFDDPVVDAARALVLIDTLGWPATWLQHPRPKFLAPSLDVVTFFHANARHSEWLLAEQESPIARGGLVGATGRVFTRDGTLVASGGAQLLCAPAPAPTG